MKKILFIFGTRPEAIKMAPLIKELQKQKDFFYVKICVTAQHREMLDQVLSFFHIFPDYDLNIMKPNQSLTELTANILYKIGSVIDEARPDLIFVQGDTTSVLTGALAAYYRKIKVAHLEAGLRSGNKFSPFPEEINRVLTGHIADYHFAPTLQAVKNLNREGIKNNIWNVGNTVIDALLLGLSIIDYESSTGSKKYSNFFKNINFSKRIVLITGHRRESFGKPFENICLALKDIAQRYNNVELVYPVHLNPNVRDIVFKYLKGIDNIKLIEPLDYPFLIYLMKRSYFVLTDSGGIQEEAPSLGKPVLVMRDVTERKEGIDAGTARLTGTNREIITREAFRLLDDANAYSQMSNAVNPYGDGKTSIKIASILKKNL